MPDAYRDFRQAGWTGAGAETAAVASGLFQGAVEGASELAMKIPGVAGVMAKFGVKPGSSWAAQFLIRSGVRGGIEVTEEIIQEATSPFIQELSAAIFDAVPDRPEGQKLKDVMGHFMEADRFMPLLLSVLPLGMIGAGLSTSRDMAIVEAVTQNRKLLRTVFSEEDAVAIESEADPVKRQALIQEKWVATPTAQIAERARAALERDKRETVEAAAAVEQAERMRMIPRIRRDAQGWTVQDVETGSIVRVGSRDEAVSMAYESLNDLERKSAEAMAQGAEEFLNFDPTQAGVMEIRRQGATPQTLAEEGVVTPEQAQAGVETYAQMHGLTPEEARAEALWVLGNNKAEMIDGVRTAVSRVMGGGNLITVMHEGIHGRWNEGLRSGRYTQAMGVQWVRMAERATGVQFLPTTNDAAVTPQQLDEAIAEVGSADLVGRRKDGKRHFTAGLISRGVSAFALSGRKDAKAAGQFAAWLKAWKGFWGVVLSNAKKLKKARAEGKLGEDFDSFLDDLLGAEPQQRFEAAAAQEAVTMAGEVDNAPFSLASFAAIKKRTDKPQLWEGVKPGHTWDSSKRFIPSTGEARNKGFITKGSWENLVHRVASWLRGRSAVDPWGAKVGFDNEQQRGQWPSGLENRAAHLLGREQTKGAEDRVKDDRKANWFGSVRGTIEGAQVRVVAKTGETLYFRRYNEGTHMVVVEDGAVKDQYGLVTQYAPESIKEFEGAVVERVQPIAGLAAQGGAGSVNLPGQLFASDEASKSGGQTEQTPNPEAQNNTERSGSESQARFSLASPVMLGRMAEIQEDETTAGELGLDESFHASRDKTLTVADPANPRDTRQGKGKAGFYTAPVESETAQYQRQGSPFIHRFNIPAEARVKILRRAGQVERLSPEQVSEWRDQGFSVVVGKAIMGQKVEVVFLRNPTGAKVDENASFSLAPRSLASVADTVLASRMKKPEFREAFYGVARQKLAGIRDQMDAIAGRAVDKTQEQWNREMKAREGFEYDRLLRENFGADTAKKQEALPVVDRQAARSEARTFAERWLEGEKKKQPTPKERQMAALRTLDAILSAFPPEIRGRVGGFVKLASLGTDKAREAEIVKRLDLLDEVVEKEAKKFYRGKIEDTFEKAKPEKGKAGEKPKGKLGAQTQALVDLARTFSALDERTSAELEAAATPSVRFQELRLLRRLCRSGWGIWRLRRWSRRLGGRAWLVLTGEMSQAEVRDWRQVPGGRA